MKRYAAPLATALILIGILACNLPLGGGAGAGTEESGAEVPVAESMEEERPESTDHPATPAPRPTPAPPPDAPAAPTALNVPLQVYNPFDAARAGEPVTSGVPLPRDLNITDPAVLKLVDAGGNPVPAQFTPLARWGGAPGEPSAPIRWVLVDFQASVDPQGATYYFLQEGGPGPAPPTPLTVTDGVDALTIDAGVANFSINKADGSLIAPGLSAPVTGQALANGKAYTASGPVSVAVALDGPLRISIHVKGTYRDASGDALLDYTSRYWFYAGQPVVRLFHTVENNRLCPLVEFGQIDCYDIGSGGGVRFDDLSLVIPTHPEDGSVVRLGIADGQFEAQLDQEVALYQDSSGTDFWDVYPTFTDWDGNPLDARPRMQAYAAFRGYRLTVGPDEQETGDQAPGWLALSSGVESWTVGVRDFWQNFPKALRAYQDGRLEVGLFPREYGGTDYAFTLRAGEHKTHEIVLGPFAGDAGPTGQLPLVAAPLFAAAPPEWYVSSGAIGPTALPNWDAWPDHEQYIAYQLDASPDHDSLTEAGERAPSGSLFLSLPDAILRTDFYGIFDYGDWPIDYEGYEVAPLNTKYDNDYGMWLQWARGSDPRWFALAEAADRHAADVDILHNLHAPRHWADGIAFGHSWHDEEGFTNPHRNGGGNHPDVAFGFRGMMTLYYLTGYEKARESALELADCFEYRLHNDYHLCDFFSDCNGEGYTLGDVDGLYESNTRPVANGLSTAVAAYRATGDPRYLAAADALVEWSPPAAQPYINGPTGEDQYMKPWLLALYLRALADYIDARDEFGLDDAYGARESYLAYADWLRTYALIELEPIDVGPRAALSYEWWFDDRQGDPTDEWSTGNNVPSINNWLLLGADALAYAYRLSGDETYLDQAAALFRTGSRDPWFVDDPLYYSESKQTINSITFGHLFLYEWERR